MASLALTTSSKETALIVPSKTALVDELYLERRKIVRQAVLEDFSTRCKDSIVSEGVAGIIAEYVVDKGFFGAHEWREVWGQIVDSEPEITQDFYKFWYGPDPIKPYLLACDTHLPPVLIPNSETDITTSAKEDYNLDKLGQIIEKPRRGHSWRYKDSNALVLRQIGKNKAKAAHWATMRKDVIARNLTPLKEKETITELNTKTGAGYEVETSALDKATVVSARHALTGERYLGDDKGAEGRYTVSRSIETVTVDGNVFKVMLGGNAPLPAKSTNENSSRIAWCNKGAPPIGGLGFGRILDNPHENAAVIGLRLT